jgi:hypothetical protein
MELHLRFSSRIWVHTSSSDMIPLRSFRWAEIYLIVNLYVPSKVNFSDFTPAVASSVVLSSHNYFSNQELSMDTLGPDCVKPSLEAYTRTSSVLRVRSPHQAAARATRHDIVIQNI